MATAAPARPAAAEGGAVSAPTGEATRRGAARRPQRRGRAEPVTVSWVNSLTIAPFFVAVDRGYFQEQGIELNLEQNRVGGRCHCVPGHGAA